MLGSHTPSIMIVAAEASGDTLGADLMQALGAAWPAPLRFIGIGGTAMAAQGLASEIDIAGLSILGFFDGLGAYGQIQRAVTKAAELAARERPVAIVLIDSWGLSIRIAQRIRRQTRGLKLFKYVGPQVWAHRAGRAAKIAAAFDHLLSTNKLDLPYYDNLPLRVTFVGNPALNTDFSDASAARFRARIQANASEPILLVMPGSRPTEIARLAAPFGQAAAILKARITALRVVVNVAEPVADVVREGTARWPLPVDLVEARDDKRDAMVAATAAIACSGTATTELALANCPMVVGYRLGAMSYAVLKPMFRLKYVTLLNIAADAMIAPEFIQERCTASALADAAAPLLESPLRRSQQAQAQTAALEHMGARGENPSMRAAGAIIEDITADLVAR